jgi:hypothetical protein
MGRPEKIDPGGGAVRVQLKVYLAELDVLGWLLWQLSWRVS